MLPGAGRRSHLPRFSIVSSYDQKKGPGGPGPCQARRSDLLCKHYIVPLLIEPLDEFFLSIVQRLRERYEFTVLVGVRLHGKRRRVAVDREAVLQQILLVDVTGNSEREFAGRNVTPVPQPDI